MSETSERRHGLEAFWSAAESADEARVEICLLSDRGFLNLRLDPRHEEAVTGAARVLGQLLPLSANTLTSGEHRVYWCGPDEWLIETGAERAADLGSNLSTELAGCHAAINDLSGGYVALVVDGEDARTVLAKGCTLDLDSREFGPGQCARTDLGKANVLLAVADDAAGCMVVVARSFADYLCRWLAHSARPHGVRFSVP